MKEKSRRTKKIRKDDLVLVIAGNSRGQKGKVLACSGDRVIVEGINMCKKHVKPSEANPKGGVVEFEKSIHVSNVQACDDEGNPLKLQVRANEEGERELVHAKGDELVVRRTLKRLKK